MSKTPIPATIREIRLNIDSPQPGTVEILEDILAALGIARENLAELTTRKHKFLSFYLKTSSRLRVLAGKLEELNLKGIRCEQQTLHKKDWVERWKEDFKPFSLGRNFTVVPAHLRRRYKPGRRMPLYIETALAFGSGLHETTRFMVQLIEHCQGRFQSFMDIGTGTGVLSVAAARCGAADIHAIDFNPDCIDVAKLNLKRNKISAVILKVVDIHRCRIKGHHDFVAANLVTHNLISAGRKLVALVAPGKYLAVSGISLENYHRFRKAFQKYPLRTVKILRGKEWAAVLYRKTGGRRSCAIGKKKKN